MLYSNSGLFQGEMDHLTNDKQCDQISQNTLFEQPQSAAEAI
jgi:hypothetical protein